MNSDFFFHRSVMCDFSHLFKYLMNAKTADWQHIHTNTNPRKYNQLCMKLKKNLTRGVLIDMQNDT